LIKCSRKKKPKELGFWDAPIKAMDFGFSIASKFDCAT
jgi:hypothetical protein